MNELVAHRLAGHGYPAAGADAQEAVKRSAELLVANGPIGPYTGVQDVNRCGTALVQLAAVQVGMRLPEAAGRTIASWEDLRRQVEPLELEPRLDPATVVRALACSSRAALAAGEVGPANGYADAALARLAEADLAADPDAGYLALDATWLASDTRWAAGRADEALALLHTAQEHYDALAAGRLNEPGRHSPAVVERLAEPVFGLHRDMADRLVATGETDLGLHVRRTLIEVLRRLVDRLGEPVRLQLGAALADLALDLRAVDRDDEAAQAAADALAVVGDRAGADPVRRAAAGQDEPGAARDRARGVVTLGAQKVSWEPLAADAAYASTDGVGPSVAEPAQSDAAVWLAAERAEAHRLEGQRREQARVEGERRQAEQEEAARAAAARAGAERVRLAEADRRAAQERAAAEETEQQERKRRRAQRIREHRLAEIDARMVELSSPGQTVAPETAADELFRLRTERVELEAEPTTVASAEPTTAPETGPAPETDVRPAPDAEAAEQVDLEPEEQVDVEPDEQVDVEHEEPVDVQPVEIDAGRDELALAQQAWQAARASGERRAARAANEAMVELLRPRAQSDPESYRSWLRSALEDLASARLRSGDLFGSRAASKEAKALSREP